ncbi:flagellin [Pseudoalteromonas sp. SR44-5]|uniref:flagellin N-terminal helical domain-containing protein n=1 Tax=Pseudoalteromonas TaxID=53246 RepID=UPI0012309070|nr:MULTISPECIES: flagellin [Pseudoalteromonas]MBB1341158.1 flagellin [Pseudoalteromonas sp. SR45-6]MBB1366725.1 flagellin [Pseudoalteromonas sp. SR44-5]MBB1416960.1 flagellin [Pseudoalteromonas sp. SG44-1]MBB1467749.1 flagellin [Pseudoalteromonas sp. SG41-5]MBB1479169.1 flagellin [Pseudoalteromonas sp. SG41-2]
MKIQSPATSFLNQTQQTSNKLAEQLATGKKVNSAADDAAALQIIDRLTSQQDGYSQAVNNAYDGISYSQATESNLSGVNDAVSRIRELSIQAGNGALNDNDRAALQEEVVQLQSQITETFENANFAGKPLFDGQSVSFQVGPDANANQTVTPSDGSFASVISTIDISTQAGAQAAIDISDQAADEINAQRAELGAFQNTLASTIKGLGTQQENIAASQSRIQDTDYAQAVSQQVSNDILAQASIALRGQANQSAESILGLL